MEAEIESSQWPREQDAKEYIAKHRVGELFDNMTAQLVYSQPSAPKEFLVEILEKLQKSKATKRDFPCIFDESNINSVFGMLDPTGRGYITVQQYREALLTLGIKEFEQMPAGHDQNKITLDIFSREAKLGLAKASSTFADKK